jgi:hypothetical protein
MPITVLSMHHYSTSVTIVSLSIWGLILIGIVYLYVRKPWRRPRFPDWEQRWDKLSRDDRRRIAEAARRGDVAASEDEAFLIAGSARSQQSYWSGRLPYDWVLLALGLILFGSIAWGWSPIAGFLGLILLVTALARLRRRRRVIDGLRRAEAPLRADQDVTSL